VPTLEHLFPQLTFHWIYAAPGDSDDVDELMGRLKAMPGIKGGYGSETEVTIIYDPTQTTPEQIQNLLASWGYPVKRP
jgi:hypothetical protein